MSTQNPLALIVEDTDDIAHMAQLVLKNAGIQSFRVNNGLSALEFLDEQTPDFMLLDIGLPMMSGWEILESIKGRYQNVDFPVIIMTAFGDPANKLIGKLQKPVVKYLVKPFAPDDLLQAVRDALQQKLE